MDFPPDVPCYHKGMIHKEYSDCFHHCSSKNSLNQLLLTPVRIWVQKKKSETPWEPLMNISVIIQVE